MKATKLTYLLVIALALTMVGTGCRKRPVGITQIPTKTSVVRPGEGMNNVPPVNLPGDNINSNESVNQSARFANPEDFNQDRSTVAANKVHFEYDSSVVKSSERVHLEAVAAYMTGNPSVGILVEGHCDERGTEDYNNSLGERRSTAVRDALIAMGVNPEHVVTRSFGEYKPVATGQDESSYKQNRRGEFVVLTPK